jgi:hypothetical protein
MVLLAGPLAAERERSYHFCVHWARRLSVAGCDVVRFDYRGIGESTARFETLTFDDWKSDVHRLVAEMRRHDKHAPLLIHGLRMGGLLGAEVFREGQGDGLLLWTPPLSARDHLWEMLRQNLIIEMSLRPKAQPKSREAYIADLEAGIPTRVDGYLWTQGLWKKADAYTLRVPASEEKRPWQIFDTARSPGHAPHPHLAHVGPVSFWETGQRIIMEDADLFRRSIEWLSSLGWARENMA